MPYSTRYNASLEEGVSSLDFSFGSQNKNQRARALERLWALPPDIQEWVLPAALTGGVLTAIGRDALRLVPSGSHEVDGLPPIGLESVTFAGFESRIIRIEEAALVDADYEIKNCFAYDPHGRSTSLMQESLHFDRCFYATVRWSNSRQVITIRHGDPGWIGLILCRAQSILHILSSDQASERSG